MRAFPRSREGRVEPFPAEVREQREVAAGVFRLWLRPYAAQTGVAPGRFYMVAVGRGLDPLLRRPLSFLSAEPAADGAPGLTLLYEVRGRGTEMLAHLAPPHTLTLIGPLGRGFRLDAPPRRVILVGGGIGAVPLYAAAQALQRHPARPRVTFIYGARTGDLLVLAPELESSGHENLICTDDGCRGEKALTTDLLERELAADPGTGVTVLACGPRPMLQRLASVCRDRGAACQVSLEARMACGMGACLTCVIRGASGRNLRVCKEGPVFDAEEVDWEALDGQA